MGSHGSRPHFREKTVCLREAKWPDEGHTAGRWPLRKEVSGAGDPNGWSVNDVSSLSRDF